MGLSWRAPLQLLAIEGMRRYGDNAEANRVSAKFLSAVLEKFVQDGTIREKYDVMSSSETHVGAGYSANVVDLAGRIGVFLELLNTPPPDQRNGIAGKEAGVSP